MKRPVLNNTLLMALMLVAICQLTGCGPTLPTYQPQKARRYLTYAVRQLPPEPVYNRLRYVHLPEPLPARDKLANENSLMLPVFEFQVENVTLDEAALILASAVRYDSYAAPSIAEREVTLTSLGTVEELAQQLAKDTDSYVFVDHKNKQIRFLAQQGRDSDLSQRKVKQNEH